MKKNLFVFCLFVVLSGCASSDRIGSLPIITSDKGLLPLANTQESLPPLWEVSFPKNERWKQGNVGQNGRTYLIEWTTAKETVNRWSQIVTYRFDVLDKSTFDRAMDYFVATPVSNCPSLRTRVIERSDGHVLLEWTTDGCNGYAAERGVNRSEYIDGGSLTLQYSQIPSQTSASFADWVQLVATAKIVVNTTKGFSNEEVRSGMK